MTDCSVNEVDIFKAPLDRLKRPLLVRLSGPDEMADKVWDEYKRYERILF